MIKIFILSLPFVAFSLASIVGNDLLFTHFTTVLLLLYFFLRKKDTRIYFSRQTSLFLFFIVYLLAALPFTIFLGKTNSRNFSQLLMILVYFFAYVLITNIIFFLDANKIKKYLNFFISICVFLALMTYLQAVFPSKLFWLDFFRNANDSFVIWYFKVKMGDVGWGNLARVSGFAAEPSIWAAFLSVPLCLLLPKLYWNFNKKDLGKFLSIFICFLLTYGRTGWLSFFLVVLTFPIFIVRGVKRKRTAVLVILLLLILSPILVVLNNMPASTQGKVSDWSKYERLWGMKNALDLFSSHPLFGVGWGGFSANLNVESRFGLIGSYAYNFYLRLLAETGIAGLGLWLLFIGTLLKKLLLKYDEIKGRKDLRIIYSGTCLAFFSVLFSWFNIESFNFMYIWFVIGLADVLPSIIEREILAKDDKGGKKLA